MLNFLGISNTASDIVEQYKIIIRSQVQMIYLVQDDEIHQLKNKLKFHDTASNNLKVFTDYIISLL